MKSIEIKQYLKTSDLTKTSVISHVIYINSKRIKVSSGLNIPVKNWNFDTQLLKKNTENALEYNDSLKKQKRQIEKIYLNAVLNGDNFTKTFLETKLVEENPGYVKKELLIFFQEWINNSKRDKTSGTIKNFQTTLNHIKKFSEKLKYNVLFETINRAFYDQFTNYLFGEKENFNSNVGRHIKNIKTFLNEMTENGDNNNLEYCKKYFKAYKDEPEIIALSVNELTQIRNCELEPRLDRVRDLFLFEAYTGLRFSDVQNLKHEKIESDFLLVPIIKTKDYLKLPLNQTAKAILEKYFDPQSNKVELPKISNQNFNLYIKEICKILEWKDNITVVKFRGVERFESQHEKHTLITTHTARRSFVTNALELGIPPTIVMQLVGHKKLETMKRYTKHNEPILTEAINKFNI